MLRKYAGFSVKVQCHISGLLENNLSYNNNNNNNLVNNLYILTFLGFIGINFPFKKFLNISSQNFFSA